MARVALLDVVRGSLGLCAVSRCASAAMTGLPVLAFISALGISWLTTDIFLGEYGIILCSPGVFYAAVS